MSSAKEVRLVGEGGVEWTFALPLSETYADQVAKGLLRPADDESAAALAPADEPGDAEPPASNGEKSIDEMSGSELDDLATKLEVDDWKTSAKVGDKKERLKAFVAAKADAEVEDVADLDDDELKAKAAELGVDVDPNADRDTVLAAVRAKLAE